MALATKKQSQRTPADLADDIARMQDEIAGYIDNRVAELKASPDCASQPAEVLRRMLIKFDCPCRAATRLTDEGD
jgi:hypothetical protein